MLKRENSDLTDFGDEAASLTDVEERYRTDSVGTGTFSPPLMSSGSALSSAAAGAAAAAAAEAATTIGAATGAPIRVLMLESETDTSSAMGGGGNSGAAENCSSTDGNADSRAASVSATDEIVVMRSRFDKDKAKNRASIILQGGDEAVEGTSTDDVAADENDIYVDIIVDNPNNNNNRRNNRNNFNINNGDNNNNNNDYSISIHQPGSGSDSDKGRAFFSPTEHIMSPDPGL